MIIRDEIWRYGLNESERCPATLTVNGEKIKKKHQNYLIHP